MKLPTSSVTKLPSLQSVLLLLKKASGWKFESYVHTGLEGDFQEAEYFCALGLFNYHIFRLAA